MFGLAIGAGIIAAYLVGSFVGGTVFERADAGFIPGILAGIWVAWPLLHMHAVERANLLHPPAKTYPLNYQEAYSKIIELLKETSYNFGDRWQISKADAGTGQIIASLRFLDEERRIVTNSLGQMQTRLEKVQRYVQLDAQLTSEGADKTTIQLDFSAILGGSKTDTVDSVILGMQTSVESRLGPGRAVREPLTHNLAAPPWWLVGTSALVLIGLIFDAGKSVSDVVTEVSNRPNQFEQAKAFRLEQRQKLDQEIESWRQFKVSQHL